MRLQDRTALITGGGTGIGAATARLFASEGSKVIIVGRRDDVLQSTVQAMRESGLDSVSCFPADVSKPEDLQAAFDFADHEYGLVDALVTSAGIVTRIEDPSNFSLERSTELIKINFQGVMSACRFFLERTVSTGHEATIVNIASICAYRAVGGYATYSATKGAVVSYTRVLAVQYAAHNIRANCVSPGVVHTPMSYVDRGDFEATMGDLASKHPLGRIGTPEDIANAVLFLTCDESAWITGQDLVVDGGLSIKM